MFLESPELADQFDNYAKDKQNKTKKTDDKLLDDNMDSPINLNKIEQFDDNYKKQKENQLKLIEENDNSSDSFENDFKQFNNGRTDLYLNGSSNEKPIEILITDIQVDCQPVEQPSKLINLQ